MINNNMSKDIYSVIVVGTSTIQSIDVKTGTVKRSMKLNGKIVSSPVVVGNKATILIQTDAGKRKGYIFNLPGLSQSFSFEVW